MDLLTHIEEIMRKWSSLKYASKTVALKNSGLSKASLSKFNLQIKKIALSGCFAHRCYPQRILCLMVCLMKVLMLTDGLPYRKILIEYYEPLGRAALRVVIAMIAQKICDSVLNFM